MIEYVESRYYLKGALIDMYGIMLFLLQHLLVLASDIKRYWDQLQLPLWLY